MRERKQAYYKEQQHAALTNTEAQTLQNTSP
jgi:hypothetical protein